MSNVNQPKMQNGIHPNSVRHLEPCSNWTIHIDETGNQFGNDKLKSNEKVMTGKFVALVVAQNANLPELPKNFHAVDYQISNPKKLDEIINSILNAEGKVGVLGIQYNDSLTKSVSNWWSGIVTLINLVLRLLPIKAPENGGNNSVQIFIEQRDLKSFIHLDAFRDELLTSLKSIDPERFANFGLKLQLTKKDGDKYNGYVDTVAHCWGGPSAQQRRKDAKFSGHCFLNQQDKQVERLYAVIDDPKKTLHARDWYEMMLAVVDEPEHSIMRGFLSQIAEKCQKNATLWFQYLAEVQARLRYKDYRTTELFETLDWLDKAKPMNCRLSSMLELQFLSAKLASQNHVGRVDLTQTQVMIELGNKLIEEDAQQVAHTYIRVATAYANAFQFEQMKTLLMQDIMQNKLAIGLSNYAKTLSSLGQYYCFTNQSEQAIDYFKQAIASFKKLSNSEQSKKDVLQTETYLMLAYLQSGQPSTRKELQKLFDVEKSLRESVETYATNGNDKALGLKADESSYKFKHHVILRMLNHENFADFRDAYLKNKESWVSGNKQHPWQAIYFWRGVLLAEKGDKVKAQEQFNYLVEQIKMNEVEDITLIWIYLVYSIAIEQMGYNIPFDIYQVYYPKVQAQINIEPYDKLAELRNTTNINEIRQLVLQCLPFNYA